MRTIEHRLAKEICDVELVHMHATGKLAFDLQLPTDGINPSESVILTPQAALKLLHQLTTQFGNWGISQLESR